MKHIIFSLMAALALVACKKDESVAGYDGNKLWQLAELDGSPFAARATLAFGGDGKVTGNGPCNAFFTEQTKPYPWIGFGPIGSTRKMCPEMDDETAFFKALSEMTLAEVSGDVMILSNDAGREMLFKAAPSGG